MKKLLLIEEDTDAREMLAFALENNGFEAVLFQIYVNGITEPLCSGSAPLRFFGL